ncbi:H/ACA ribonucleoprotein complex subunit 1-like [Mya arenaria]|uniref:H/ACA ribonucleoprotein complex subunit 1-like n=1 Tax=Mya arenaria TaxID=6604 RepID=UPI0022E6EB61|nr:H/ACA ribonucleoprotein complex subunit 1-like [Mya arenaria]
MGFGDRGGGGFRGGRGGDRGGRGRGGGDRGFRGGGRGGFGGRGGGRGGFNRGFDQGPPDQVVEMGTMAHTCEDDLVCKGTNEKVPYFNAPIFLENKEQIGKVDEIFGQIQDFYFSIKLSENMKSGSFSKDQKFYIDPYKLLPLARFLEKPKGRGRGGRGGGDRGRGGRGGGRGFGGRGGGGRGGFGGRGGGGGFRGGRGGGGRGGGRGGGFNRF